MIGLTTNSHYNQGCGFNVFVHSYVLFVTSYNELRPVKICFIVGSSYFVHIDTYNNIIWYVFAYLKS